MFNISAFDMNFSRCSVDTLWFKVHTLLGPLIAMQIISYCVEILITSVAFVKFMKIVASLKCFLRCGHQRFSILLKVHCTTKSPSWSLLHWTSMFFKLFQCVSQQVLEYFFLELKAWVHFFRSINNIPCCTRYQLDYLFPALTILFPKMDVIHGCHCAKV
jgi:hypothetical protein